MKKLLPFVILILAAALTGCRSHRNTTAGQYTADSIKTVTPDTIARPVVVKELAAQCRDSWHDVTVPVSASLMYPMRQKVSGKVTMIQDHSIKFSVTVLGMEMGALYIDSDSLFFYERLNKTAVAESTKALTQRTGLTVSDLQQILIGQPSETLISKPCKQAPTGEGKTALIPALPAPDVELGMMVDQQTPAPRLMGMALKVVDNYLVISYTGVTQTQEAGNVAQETLLDGIVAAKPLSATITWKWESARWNRDLSPTPLNIPSGYRRVPAAVLLKALSKK